MMSLFSRLLLMLAFAAWAGQLPAATTSSTKSKSKSSSKGTSSTKSSGKSEGTVKKETFSKPDEKTSEKAKDDEVVKKEEPRPAAVSTVSIEEIRDFDKYPKQVQSLVQSALALTHLELRYMYGSHEPSNGGMDCSGTIYHVLHFQGLKDVPRQSDEMAMWVDKKTQLHLTPTATSFDSPEFDALKPGDMLFWTNTIATTRKLPVTHVMIYLGKLKKDGKRIVFGASDGRSYSGQRRSGVSVFDFSLPRAEGTARLHGYGRAPGLMPAEDVILAAAKAAVPPAPPTPEPVAMPPPPALAKTTPAKEEPSKKPLETTATAKTSPAATEETKIEVRKAVAVVTGSAEATIEEDKEFVPAYRKRVPSNVGTTKSETPGTTATTTPPKTPETKAEQAKSEPEKVVASSTSTAKHKSTTATKPKTSSSSSSTKKKSTTVSAKRRAPPPKSAVGQTVDRAVDSMKRFFR